MHPPQCTKFAPKSLRKVALCFYLSAAGVVFSQTEYDFGNPGANEQELLEQINYARANPTAEGIRLANLTDPDVLQAYNFFGVDLNLMKAELAVIPVAPPLAHNKLIAQAALGHSQWMFNNRIQAHAQTNPSNTVSTRVTAAGYVWSTLAESIFAFSENITHCHAAFEVDWGNDGGAGGMQIGRGHRVANHNPLYREIGIGIVAGRNGPVGPLVITEDFGTDQVSSRYFATGVAYYDLDGDNFYDAGEGIGGLRVDASGPGITNFCQTADGGGWVIPMTTTEVTRTISFSSPGFSQGVSMTVPKNANAKADLKLSYVAPAITSPLSSQSSTAYPLTFAGVVGAKTYRWTAFRSEAAPNENCESLTGTVAELSPSYSALSTTIFQQGQAAYRLRNSNGSSQTLELSGLYHGDVGASLTYASRIRFARTEEFFRLQVKEEGSAVWMNVDSQQGTNSSGQATFATRAVSLSSMVGKRFRIRFMLLSTGSFYMTADDQVGWFFDDIRFSNVRRLASQGTGTTSSTAANVSLPMGTYLIYVAPIISDRDFPSAFASITIESSQLPASYVVAMKQVETSASLVPGTISDHPWQDFDGDGLLNLAEYAFGTSVLGVNDPNLLPQGSLSDGFYILSYRRDLSKSDVNMSSEASISLKNWRSVGENGAPEGYSDELISKTGDIEFRRARIPISAGSAGFIRVKIEPK